MSDTTARRRAYKLALKLMRSEIHKVSFDVKLSERYGVQSPYALRCQHYYQQLQDSIKCLSSDLAKVRAGSPSPSKAARKGLPHE